MTNTFCNYPFVLNGEILYFRTNKELPSGIKLINDNDTVEITEKHTKTNNACEISREIYNSKVKTTKTSTQWKSSAITNVLHEHTANQFIYYNRCNHDKTDYVVVTILGDILLVFFAESGKTMFTQKYYQGTLLDNRITASGKECGLVLYEK